MTTWETNVTEIVWESQTAPGITWTTVVGGTGGTEIPARRLLPNTVGTPGQTVVVNDAGTAVEYVDAPSGGGSFPTNTNPTTDPPEPVDGASWRPSDSPSLLALAADNKWRGGWLADDGTDQTAETVDPDAITWVSTTAPGTFRFGAGGITVGSLGFWLLEADPRSGSGHPGAVGSVVWSSTVGSWLRKTGAGATAWEIAGGGAALSDDDPAALGVATPGTSDDASRSDHVHPMPTAADVGALDDGAVRSIASGYAADALSDANDYTDTAVAGKQAADADLTAIAALAPADDALIQRKAGAWTSRTPAQVKADMSIGVGDVSGLDENTRDVIGTALVAGSGVAVTVDDPGNTITIAVSGVVADAINDGVTTVAPSQNAVFDALSIKVPKTLTIASIDLEDNVTAAELRAALGIEWVPLTDETLASNAASWTGPTGLGSYDEIRVVVTGRTTQGSSAGAVNLRFNGNSTSGDYINGGGASSTWLTIGSIAGSLTNTNRWGRLEAIIQNKVGTLHTVQSQYAITEANTNPPNSSHDVYAAGHFKQTAAITSMVVYPSGSTDFVAGTRFRVFGRLP